MKKLKLFSLLGVVVIIALYSCSKGDTGATGPKGPAGPDSVYSSPWITIDQTFQGLDGNGDSIYQQTLTAPAVTQAIIDSGVVNSYIEYYVAGANGGSQTAIENADDYNEIIFTSGEIVIESFSYFSTFNPSNGIIGFRYVVIPGNVLATTAALQNLTKAQIHSMSYARITSIVGNAGNGIKSN